MTLNSHVLFQPINPIRTIQILQSAHQTNINIAQLMSELKLCISQYPALIQTYAASICHFLYLNLKNNTRIIDTASTLPLVHKYTSNFVKKQITNILCKKYPSEVCFYSQILTLTRINATLIQPFLSLIRSISTWFSLQVEQKQYSKVQPYQLEYIINYLYSEERYIFQNNLQFQDSHTYEAVLTIYRIISSNHQIINGGRLNQAQIIKIAHTIFYFLCNLSISQAAKYSKYVFFAVGEILKQLSFSTIQVHDEMAQLLIPKIRKICLQKSKKQNTQLMISLLRNLIINIFLSSWSVEIEHFWLWRFKLICDLLSIDPIEQLNYINEIKMLFKQISKFIGI